MRAQIKVVLLVAVCLAVTLSAVIWKSQSLLLEDKVNFVNDSAMKQLAPLKRLVSEKLENDKNDLVRFATSREAAGPGHATSFGAFDAIALVEMSAANAQWTPTWIEKGPSLRTEKWSEGYDLTLLRSLPYQKVKDGSSFWVRLSDAQGAPLYALLESVEIQASAPTAPPPAPTLPNAVSPVAAAPVTTPGAPRRAIIVGFASENPLGGVTDDFIGSTNSVYIVDDRGYVASHTKASYVGSSFADDKLTQEIAKTSKVTDTRETSDMDGQKVLGHFERIDRTNLAAIITTPLTAATGLAQSFTHSILLLGFLITLLALFAAYIVGATIQAAPVRVIRETRETTGDDDVETNAAPPREPSAPIAAPAPVPREELMAENAISQDERLRDERKNAFEAFNAGLAARLREPLLAILGHAQLAKQKSGDPELAAHTESIEREARLAKEAIDRFQVIEESSSLGRISEKCDLEKVALTALAEKAIEIEGSGITLEQHLSHVPKVLGRAPDMEAMIVHVLENSIEAMRDRPMKKLTVQLAFIDGRVRLMIADTGIGMSRDVQQRAFEPFYKGFEAPRHMGLGLAFVHTTMKRVGASHKLESAPGEGTVFTIEFPVDPDARKEFEAATAAPDLGMTLGGRKPISGSIEAPTPPPSPVMEAPPPAPAAASAMTAAPSVLSTIEAPPPAPSAESAMLMNEFTISSITNPAMEAEPSDDEGFRVKIRRPKPRGP